MGTTPNKAVRVALLGTTTMMLSVMVVAPRSAVASTTTLASYAPPYSDTYGTTEPTGASQDSFSTASASSSQDGSTGYVSVNANVSTSPLVPVNTYPFAFDTPKAGATALVSVTSTATTVSPTATITVQFTNISVTTSGSQQAPLGLGLGLLSGGGGYVDDYVVWYDYACGTVGACPPSWGSAYAVLNQVYPDGGTIYPTPIPTTATLSAPGVPTGGVLVVKAGLGSQANAQGGPAQFTADGSATVASITLTTP